MPAPSTPPKHTELPIDRVIATRPRRGLLAGLGIAAAVLLIVAIVAVTNDGDDDGPDASGTADGLVGNRWRIIGVSGVEGGEEPPPAVPVDGSLALEVRSEEQLSFTGCNGGFGHLRIERDRLEAFEMASTMMGCAGPEGEILMDWDRWFAGLLMGGVDVTANGGRLVLTGEAGIVELELDGPVAEDPPVEDPDAPVSSDSTSSDAPASDAPVSDALSADSASVHHDGPVSPEEAPADSVPVEPGGSPSNPEPAPAD